VDLESKPAHHKAWFPVIKARPLEQQQWEPLTTPQTRRKQHDAQMQLLAAAHSAQHDAAPADAVGQPAPSGVRAAPSPGGPAGPVAGASAPKQAAAAKQIPQEQFTLLKVRGWARAPGRPRAQWLGSMGMMGEGRCMS
jgi:hypothetical protein